MFRTAEVRSQPSRRKPCSGRLRILVAGCLAALTAFSATRAEEPVSPETTESALDAGVELVSRRMDEIVVYAYRGMDGRAYDSLLVNPLRERILKEIRPLDVLDQPFEWRMETAHLEVSPPRIRFGYDPRTDERAAEFLTAQLLPLDLMRPATIISVDF